MPWKQGYTISDETSLPDSALRWPEAARCCASVTVDLSLARGPEGIRAKDLPRPDAFFALNDGLDQLLAILRRHGFKATFAVPAVLAGRHAARLRALIAEGHEIAAGGLRHEDISALPREEEAARIAAATELLADATGRQPRGWYSLPRPRDPFAGGTISPNTMDLLIDAGYEWFGNGLADDIPHWWVTDPGQPRAILALPYYYHFDDQFFALFPTKGTGLENPDFLERNWHAEFDAQYKRGRQFSMTLHPQASGWADRAEMLDRFLAYVRSRPGVWNPTGTECAHWWESAFPRARYLNVEPSIWTEFPDSLS